VVPRCKAGAGYSDDADYVYEVGDATVFMKPSAARHRYPNLDIGIADVAALVDSLS